ncbi:hypothetical protein, partial [Phocaeicola plebeius]|uniref:hypothetical protein n=1 Tax=Phocaeicola plebeius TaxID=310297 RepID=UPI0026F00EF7
RFYCLTFNLSVKIYRSIVYDGFQKGWLSYQPLSFYIFQLIDWIAPIGLILFIFNFKKRLR